MTAEKLILFLQPRWLLFHSICFWILFPGYDIFVHQQWKMEDIFRKRARDVLGMSNLLAYVHPTQIWFKAQEQLL